MGARNEDDMFVFMSGIKRVIYFIVDILLVVCTVLLLYLKMLNRSYVGFTILIILLYALILYLLFFRGILFRKCSRCFHVIYKEVDKRFGKTHYYIFASTVSNIKSTTLKDKDRMLRLKVSKDFYMSFEYGFILPVLSIGALNIITLPKNIDITKYCSPTL